MKNYFFAEGFLDEKIINKLTIHMIWLCNKGEGYVLHVEITVSECGRLTAYNNANL